MRTATWVLGALVCAASCDGRGETPSADAKNDASAKAEGEKKGEEKGEAKAGDAPAKAEAPASAAKYSAPKDICALADLSLLGPTAGKAGDGYAENETGDLPTPGCAFDLVAGFKAGVRARTPPLSLSSGDMTVHGPSVARPLATLATSTTDAATITRPRFARRSLHRTRAWVRAGPSGTSRA